MLKRKVNGNEKRRIGRVYSDARKVYSDARRAVHTRAADLTASS